MRVKRHRRLNCSREGRKNFGDGEPVIYLQRIWGTD